MKKTCTYLFVSLFFTGLLMAEDIPLDAKLTKCLELNQKTTGVSKDLKETRKKLDSDSAKRDNLAKQLKNSKNQKKIAELELAIKDLDKAITDGIARVKTLKSDLRNEEDELAQCGKEFKKAVNRYSTDATEEVVSQLSYLCTKIKNAPIDNDFVGDLEETVCEILYDVKLELKEQK